MRGINQRELGRKERATAECERQIRRYGYECGEARTNETGFGRQENSK